MIPIKIEDMVKYIKNSPKSKEGITVNLLGCQSGLYMNDESKHYAQKLSNMLNVKVRAPSTFIWFSSDGTTSIYEPKIENGKTVRDFSKKGQLNEFYPKK